MEVRVFLRTFESIFSRAMRWKPVREKGLGRKWERGKSSLKEITTYRPKDLKPNRT